MSPLVIIPNYIRDEIYAKVDAQIAEHPDAASDRELFYDTILAHFGEHGVIPDFTLQRREPQS